MIYLIGAVLIMLLALGIVALGYRGKAKAEQRHAELQQQRAESAEFINANRQQLDTELASLHEAHQEEIIHANNPENLAVRNDFADAWSGATGMRDTGAGTDGADGATATGSTGATGDFIEQDDMLGR